MPNKETILITIRNLHPHAKHKVPDHKEDQVWGGKEYGTRFKVSKTGGSDITDIVTLEARGTARNRKRLIEDFVTALGKPKTIETNNHANPQTVTWKIK